MLNSRHRQARTLDVKMEPPEPESHEVAPLELQIRQHLRRNPAGATACGGGIAPCRAPRYPHRQPSAALRPRPPRPRQPQRRPRFDGMPFTGIHIVAGGRKIVVLYGVTSTWNSCRARIERGEDPAKKITRHIATQREIDRTLGPIASTLAFIALQPCAVRASCRPKFIDIRRPTSWRASKAHLSPGEGA